MSSLGPGEQIARDVLSGAAQVAVRPTEYVPSGRGLIGIDLGCGSNKKPNTVGVDVVAGEGVDVVCDIGSAPLPFEDDSVEYVYSSHCFEHLPEPTVLVREIPRVCADGATFELWMPYSWHAHAHVFGHVSYWNEEPFLAMTRRFRDIWRVATGVVWNLHELVYVTDVHALQSAERLNIPVEFAIRHLVNVVGEFGVIGSLDKPGEAGSPPPPLKVSVSPSRLPEHRTELVAPHWC